VTVIDELLAYNQTYAATFTGPRSGTPVKRLAVLACMDARLDVPRMLGLQEGDAHLISNAGGVVTDDEVRSLAISQRMLGTREIMLIHHTGCGLLTFTDDEFTQALLDDTGAAPPWPVETFTDLDDDVRTSMDRIERSPFIPYTDQLRGFVFDVATGRLREVSREP
jgi:carbonic anhydrase